MVSWPQLFIKELNALQKSAFENAPQWFDRLRDRINVGEAILEQLGHVVDSELPGDIDDLRGVWQQTDELTRLVSSGVSGLRHGLDIAIMQYQRREGISFSASNDFLLV